MISDKNVNILMKIINGTMNELDEFEPKELLRLIELHNIPGRIIQRINMYGYHNYFSQDFVTKLEALYEEFTDAVEKNIVAVSDVLREYEKNGNTPPVVIKGFSNYILTNERMVIRKGDIDIVPSDVDELINILLRKQYKLTKSPFMHEAGEYSKEGIEFDVHLFFPVYRYDEKVSLMLELRNTMIGMPFEKICYDDLSINKYESLKRTGLFVADANMMIIIICSHAFMNYTNIWSISHREKTYIKIGELWDIFDLVKHETYSVEKFCEYVQKYRAEDCVRWTCSILNELFEDNPLPYQSIALVDFSKKFPKCLWWDFWDYLPTSRIQLLSDDWYDISNVMECLGKNVVQNNAWNNVSVIDKKYLIGNVDILFMIKEGRLIINKTNGITNYDCHYRVEFGKAAIEICVCDKILQIGNSSNKIDVVVSEYELSIELISDMFILCYRDTNDGLNEVLIPILTKEA